MCVCMCVRVYVCVRACVCIRVHVCLCSHAHNRTYLDPDVCQLIRKTSALKRLVCVACNLKQFKDNLYCSKFLIMLMLTMILILARVYTPKSVQLPAHSLYSTDPCCICSANPQAVHHGLFCNVAQPLFPRHAALLAM